MYVCVYIYIYIYTHLRTACLPGLGEAQAEGGRLAHGLRGPVVPGGAGRQGECYVCIMILFYTIICDKQNNYIS